MKIKCYSLLLAGLALLLLSFTVGCGKTEAITPKVYELSVNEEQTKDTEKQELGFQLKIGDRVEGEVNTSIYQVKTSVIDPYGNMVIESLYPNQEYPWNFAFFAATIELQSYLGYLPRPFSANIKITVYGK